MTKLKLRNLSYSAINSQPHHTNHACRSLTRIVSKRRSRQSFQYPSVSDLYPASGVSAPSSCSTYRFRYLFCILLYQAYWQSIASWFPSQSRTPIFLCSGAAYADPLSDQRRYKITKKSFCKNLMSFYFRSRCVTMNPAYSLPFFFFFFLDTKYHM